MKKTQWIVLVVVFIFLFFVTYWVAQKRKNIKLKFETVEVGTLLEAVYGIGKIMSHQVFQYKTGVPTTITHLYVQEGQEIKKGDLLLELDNMTRVKSPLQGTVTSIQFNVGENTIPNSVVLSVMDLKDLYVLVSLEQQGALKVQKDQVVKINFESLREKTYLGKVESIYSDTKEFLVRIKAEEFPSNVLPGMTADVAIVIQEKKNCTMVPLATIKDSKVKVLLANGQIEERVVKMGLVDGERVEILSNNLKSEDRVLLQEGK